MNSKSNKTRKGRNELTKMDYLSQLNTLLSLIYLFIFIPSTLCYEQEAIVKGKISHEHSHEGVLCACLAAMRFFLNAETCSNKRLTNIEPSHHFAGQNRAYDFCSPLKKRNFFINWRMANWTRTLLKWPEVLEPKIPFSSQSHSQSQFAMPNSDTYYLGRFSLLRGPGPGLGCEAPL